jgi:predicted ribosome quality control (RQC) complex YloA/Tae2 family protein
VSNTVRYDPLLVHYLATELRDRLRSRACAAAPFFAPDLSVTLPFESGEQLRVDLHPTRGWFRLLSSPTSPPDVELEATCVGVSSPEDERIIRIDLFEEGRFRDQSRAIVFELHTNQWNAILVGEDERIVTILRPRRAGRRSLYPGERYVEPVGEPRYGALAVDRDEAWGVWMRTLEKAPRTDHRRTLLTSFAWTGTTNVDWILGDESAPLEASFDRWWHLRSRPPADPVLLKVDHGTQPYPLPLEGMASRTASSILEAMTSVADDTAPAAPADARIDLGIALAEERAVSAARRAERLRQELSSAGESDRFKGIGDLLLARLQLVPRGAGAVELEGWDGETVHVTLDPRLSAADNARWYYDEAGRKRRAEERLPQMLLEAEREAERWRSVAEDLASGVPLPPWLAEELRRREQASGDGGRAGAAPPYRSFRTSGGLEVRVGRNAKDNDRLTFHASSPNDVWLHARSVAGSHVILRWRDAEGSPPARDLTEAAMIAAVFSRARTSGTVPVDWTRRKYVRKPRGAPAGTVIPQRVRTLFVEPDEALVEALRVND